MRPARLEARMDSLFSFPVGLFHPLQHAGLSRRTPSSRLSAHNDLTALSSTTGQILMRANSRTDLSGRAWLRELLFPPSSLDASLVPSCSRTMRWRVATLDRL